MRIPVFYSTALAGPNPNQAKCLPVVGLLKREFGPENFVHMISPSEEPTAQVLTSLTKVLHHIHDEAYLRGIFMEDKKDGYGETDGSNLDSIMTALCCWSAAVKEVCEGKAFCAMAPVGGFHHARYASGGGYCTFNGLMLGERMAATKYDRQAGILDMDEHYGDGTADIIDKLRLNTPHSTLGLWKDARGVPMFGRSVVDRIPAEIGRLVAEGADILFYQAGADPHIDDPLGGRMSTEELRARDRLVFQTCRNLRLPVVWCLAGGYQIGRAHV